MSDNIFIGSARDMGNYNFMTGSICLDDIPAQHIQTAKNNKRYVKIKINKRKDPDKYGNTHFITINTYKNDRPGNN